MASGKLETTAKHKKSTQLSAFFMPCFLKHLVLYLFMQKLQAQKNGIKKNKLLRYQAILNYYNEVKNEDIPTTVIHRKYIYPKFFISRTTLYEVLGTPVVKQLKELAAAEAAQTSLF